jgi:hypothetical protein
MVASRALLLHARGGALLAGWLDDGDPFGTLSSVPIGWREGTSESVAATFLGLAVLELVRLEEETGRRIAIALEPEPGCVFDDASDAIAWWNLHLRSEMKRLHLGEAVVARHLGSLLRHVPRGSGLRCARRRCPTPRGRGHFRPQGAAFVRPCAPLPNPGRARRAARARRTAFSAPNPRTRGPGAARFGVRRGRRVAHESTAIEAESSPILRFDDLPDLRAARDRGEIPPAGEARCHFHIPIHLEETPRFATTRRTLLEAVAAFPNVRHLEVETYTFDVLPADLKAGASATLAAELRYADSVIECR